MIFSAENRDDLVKVLKYVADQTEQEYAEDPRDHVWLSVTRLMDWCTSTQSEAFASKMRATEICND
jgi:hypothetical protein